MKENAQSQPLSFSLHLHLQPVSSLLLFSIKPKCQKANGIAKLLLPHHMLFSIRWKAEADGSLVLLLLPHGDPVETKVGRLMSSTTTSLRERSRRRPYFGALFLPTILADMRLKPLHVRYVVVRVSHLCASRSKHDAWLHELTINEQMWLVVMR